MSFNHNYNRGMQITPVVRDLLIINILFFVGTQLLSANNKIMLALFYPESDFFRPFQLATHFFMHADFRHILFNMMSLYVFGVMLELIWGGKRFLIYYFICALGAALGQFAKIYWDISHADPLIDALMIVQNINTPMVGASGAIYGIAIASWFVTPEKAISLMFFPVPIEFRYFVPLMLLSDFYFGFSNIQNDNTAHFAHLGGALTGALILFFWNKNSMTR